MIRFADMADIPNIMHFIDMHWAKGHILAVSKDFFLFQHNYQNEISFVLSTDAYGEINGILGYIPYGKSNRDIMTVTWKVLHTDNPMLGVDLLNFLIQHGDIRIVASLGINKKTIGIYQFLGYETGKMSHWYRLRSNADYRIASISDKEIPTPVTEQVGYHLELYSDFDQLEKHFYFDGYIKEKAKPFKEPQYIKHRYFEHPIYHYKVYGVTDPNGEAKLLLIFRKQPYNSSVALRLIDCIGDYSLLQHTISGIDALLAESQAEYVDIYETGLPDQLLVNSGWRKVEDTPNIIPEYFAPYSCKNIDIYYFSTVKDIVLFKGDGDQDRPNTL